MSEIVQRADYGQVIDERRRLLSARLVSILSRQTEFVWEVGCGHGHFLTAYAQAHPQQVCVGVDLAGDRIARAERKRDRARLAHLHFLQGEARLFLEAIPAGRFITAIFVLFPDPWPKLRHHKHRILQAEFLTQLRPKAGQGARLYFRTDYLPYFEQAAAGIRAHRDWQVVDEPWPFEYETVFQQRAESYHSLVARPRS